LSRLDERFQRFVIDGPSEGEYKSRSEYTHAVACGLRLSDYSDGEIISVLINDKYKASEHIREQKQRTPVRQAMRNTPLRQKLGALITAGGDMSPQDYGTMGPSAS
jgi:hypothetical protein